jgi:hypothetical protein
MDPDTTPDPTPFFIDFKGAKKFNFWLQVLFLFCKHYFRTLNIFMRKREPDLDPIHMTNGSGSGRPKNISKAGLPRLNGGRLKRRAAPRMASAALAAVRPRARAGADGAGRVNRCQPSTPDRVSRLTPPVSRHDRPKWDRIKQHSRAQRHSRCAQWIKECSYSGQLRKQHNMLPVFHFCRKQILKFMSSIPECSFFYTVDPVLRSESDLNST